MKNTKFTTLLFSFTFFIFFLSLSVKAQNKIWKIDEGFEGGVIPAGWTIYDIDGDGKQWEALEDAYAHTGAWMASVKCTESGGHDWLITPQVTIEAGDFFNFYGRSWYGVEDMNVKLSATGNATGDFTVTLESVIGLDNSYSLYSYDLSAYAGQNIYLAIEWNQDSYALIVDDVKVGQLAPTIILPDNFTFEQDDELIVDFSQYIEVINPDISTLSVTGNTNVLAAIDGFEVTFTSPGWFGTETLTFEVDDGLGKATASDDVDVIVTEIAANDVGVLSIEIPTDYTFTGTEIIPTFTIKNFGTDDITESFQLNCEIRDTLAVLAYSALSSYSGGIAAGAIDQVSFSGAWTPDEIGTYTVKIWTALTGDQNPDNDTMIIETEVVIHYGTGGPDAMGYEWIDSQEDGGPVYNWIEISETGESAIMYEPGVTFSGDDNMSPPIPFGFSFPYYGIDRTDFYVDTNGEILLTDNTWYNHYPNVGWNYDGNMFNYMFPIPGFSSMPALIAVYWDDLHADEGTGDIYFQTFGTAPDRYCVVEWHNFRFCYGTVTDTTLCFEAIFHENGDIIFQYKDVAIGQTGSACPHDNGRSSTIGIQNDNTDIGLSYLFEIVENQTYIGVEPLGNLLTDELAIKFFQGEDLYAPYFDYEYERGNTFDTTPEITVEVTDMAEILYDSLYYNIGNGWQAIASAGKSFNTFIYQLPEISKSTTVNYYFAVTDDSPAQNRGTLPADAPSNYFSFKILPTDNIDLLLVHPGTVPGYQDYTGLEFSKFTAGFNAFGINYDFYNWEEYNQYKFPDSYKTIFMYGNSIGHSDSEDTLCLALYNFLDLGTNENPKNIFTAADDISDNAYVLYSYNLYDRPLMKFYYAYLRGRHIPTGNGGGTDGIGGPEIYDYSDGSIIGVADSPIGTEGVELNVYSNSPDVISNGTCLEYYNDEVTNPDISSYNSFLFEDGPHSGNAYAKGKSCAVWLDNLIYKSFFTSFDISQFTDADINTMIQEALDWFGHVPTGIEPNLTTNEDFNINIFPNPCNGTFNLKFSNYDIQNVLIELINIHGQVVFEQTITNLNNENKINVSGLKKGFYFVRVNIGNEIKTKKLIIE
ncbi:MAG: choice-of-anchor J domain-containing protein [Bacteroidales bacterium]|nr:choice-of-anchor J domain-containing protein [Bacteroidales bacterium]